MSENNLCKTCGCSISKLAAEDYDGECRFCCFSYEAIGKGVWRHENEDYGQGGETFYLVPEADLSELPDELARLLNHDARWAFEDPDAYFTSLATACRLAGMKRWLEYIASHGFEFLQIKPFFESVQLKCLVPDPDVTCLVMLKSEPDPVMSEHAPAPMIHFSELLNGVEIDEGALVNLGEVDIDDFVFGDWPHPREGLFQCFLGTDDNPSLMADSTNAYWTTYDSTVAGPVEAVFNSFFDRFFTGEGFLPD